MFGQYFLRPSFVEPDGIWNHSPSSNWLLPQDGNPSQDRVSGQADDIRVTSQKKHLELSGIDGAARQQNAANVLPRRRLPVKVQFLLKIQRGSLDLNIHRIVAKGNKKYFKIVYVPAT